VARDRAALAESLRDGPTTRVADARDRQRDILRDAGGLPVAPVAERLAAVGDDAAWRDDGRFERINHALVMADRERVGRDASPSAAIIDSQSVKTTEAGGPRGYDAGKKINGRKRHALVDTDGRGLVLEPHPANIQDRDGGGPLLRASYHIFPFIQRVFADSGYAGEKVAKATVIAVQIVRKNLDQVGFAVNPRRWVVERFFAWIGRNRRLAKDFEATIDSAQAFLYTASVMLLVRRIARTS
jgi:transposase